MQTAPLSRRRCFHHSLREAVARCPECEKYFCRECITEHEDRVICAACLQKVVAGPKKRRFRFGPAARVCVALTGLLIAWLFFHLIGSALLAIPSSVHNATLWSSAEEEEE